MGAANDWQVNFTVTKSLVDMLISTKFSPEYKGEWKPKQIKNPNYKGKWIHPEIDNPEYKPDDDLYMREDWGAVGIDIWQACIYLTCEFNF